MDTNYKNDDSRIYTQKRTNLKQVMIVRYADDFKLFCKTHEQAVKIYYATKQWLKERLKLDVSEEKTRKEKIEWHTQYCDLRKTKVVP